MDKMTRKRSALLVLALLSAFVSGVYALDAVFTMAMTSWLPLLGLPAVVLGLNALSSTVVRWYYKPVREETEQIRLETRESLGRLAAMREFSNHL